MVLEVGTWPSHRSYLGGHSALLVDPIRSVDLVVLPALQISVVVGGVETTYVSRLGLVAKVHSLQILPFTVAHSRTVPYVEVLHRTVSALSVGDAAWSTGSLD